MTEEIVEEAVGIKNGESRRQFLAKVAGATVAGLAASTLLDACAPAPTPTPTATPSLPGVAKLPEATANEDVVLQMMRDLQRALRKPQEQRLWSMVIDLSKCVGCSACTVACIVENKLPPGVVYRPVLDEEIGEYPSVTRRFTPRPCMQCENPPCVPACPYGATWKQSDGIVIVDYDKCVGQEKCLPFPHCQVACPYRDSPSVSPRTFDYGNYYTGDTPTGTALVLAQERTVVYENAQSFEYRRTWARQGGKAPVGKIRKCQFCYHRLQSGMLPACTTTCIGRATYFGDANDPDSLVTKLAASPNAKRLREGAGTKPKVYYLNLT